MFFILLLQTTVNGVNLKLPTWEQSSNFNPLRAARAVSRTPAWRLINGKTPQPSAHINPNFEDIIRNNIPFSVQTLPLRDPERFVPGQLHQHVDKWEEIIRRREDTSPPNNEIRAWLINGVDATDMFTHFKGQFKGLLFDSGEPPKMYFPNADNSCKEYIPFIVSELETRLANGALSLLGSFEGDDKHLISAKIFKKFEKSSIDFEDEDISHLIDPGFTWINLVL